MARNDLTPVQCFLDRYFKRKYTSKRVSDYDLLERQDRKNFRKTLKDIHLYLLYLVLNRHYLRKETCLTLCVSKLFY